MSSAPQAHGVILHIEEILADPKGKAGETVRVLGKLLAFDPVNNMAQIEHAHTNLVVDTSLLGNFSHRNKSLLQFIGELDDWVVPARQQMPSSPATHAGGEYVILRARIVRNVDGLDLTLYDKALQIRRKFDEERSHVEF
ncbi:hypothetical protein HDV00_004536 [Rhizophlyctis rosea]|nr:hypothetical protein HDV00_004536 [Rhizophlyctis rosea]